MILFRIRDNGNEIAWESEPNRHFVQKNWTKNWRENETFEAVKTAKFRRPTGKPMASNRRGWTQDTFADRLQLAGWYNATRSTVSKIEDGSLRIDLVQLYCIATALGIRPGDLLAEVDWRKQVEKMICSPMKHHKQLRRMETIPKNEAAPATPATERLAYSIQEAADMLGVNYFSVYRLIQRNKLKVCRALRGKLLVPRTELLKLLATE